MNLPEVIVVVQFGLKSVVSENAWTFVYTVFQPLNHLLCITFHETISSNVLPVLGESFHDGR